MLVETVKMYGLLWLSDFELDGLMYDEWWNEIFRCQLFLHWTCTGCVHYVFISCPGGCLLHLHLGLQNECSDSKLRNCSFPLNALKNNPTHSFCLSGSTSPAHWSLETLHTLHSEFGLFFFQCNIFHSCFVLCVKVKQQDILPKLQAINFKHMKLLLCFFTKWLLKHYI